MTKRKADTSPDGAVSPSGHATEALAEAIAAALIAGSAEQLAAAVLRDARERGAVAVPSPGDGRRIRGRRVEAAAGLPTSGGDASERAADSAVVEYEACPLRTGGSCGRCGAQSVSDSFLERRLMEAARGGDTEGALWCVARRFANLLHSPRCTAATTSTTAVDARQLFSRVGILQSDSAPPTDASGSIGRSALYHAAFSGHSATVAALSMALRALDALSGDVGVSVRSPFLCDEDYRIIAPPRRGAEAPALPSATACADVAETAATTSTVTVRCVAICSSAVPPAEDTKNSEGRRVGEATAAVPLAVPAGQAQHDSDEESAEEDTPAHELDVQTCLFIANRATPRNRYREASDRLLRYAGEGDIVNVLSLVADFGVDVNTAFSYNKHLIPYTSAHYAALQRDATKAVAMLRALREGSTVCGPCECCGLMEAKVPDAVPTAIIKDASGCVGQDTAVLRDDGTGREETKDCSHGCAAYRLSTSPSSVDDGNSDDDVDLDEVDEDRSLLHFMPPVWPRAWRRANINAVDSYGHTTPLGAAVATDTCTMAAINFLLEDCGPTLAAVGRVVAASPLVKAVEYRRVDVAETLLRFGADPNAVCPLICSLSPLHAAGLCFVGAPSSTSEGEMSAAPDTAVAQIIRLLIDAGADVTIADDVGDTPLVTAARRFRCAVVAALLRERGEVFSVAEVEAARDVAMAIGTDRNEDRRSTIKVLNDHLLAIVPPAQ